MVLSYEKISRIKDYFNFSKDEQIGLIVSVLVTGFIFSINFPGDSFSLIGWLSFLIITTVIAAISLFLRISMQKVHGLWKGYLVEFKPWWGGIAASLLIAFATRGYVPLILAGTISSTFMVRQRLGEFRYGYSYSENAKITNWGLITNLILATIFGFFLFLFPDNAFFRIGMLMNIMIGISMYLPFPKLEGILVYFGSRSNYIVMWLTFVIASVILITQTKIGLFLLIGIGSIVAIIKTLWGE